MDAYTVLGVSRDMSIEQVKTVYNRLCLIYHPDKGLVTKDSKFIEINRAWGIIKNSGIDDVAYREKREREAREREAREEFDKKMKERREREAREAREAEERERRRKDIWKDLDERMEEFRRKQEEERKRNEEAKKDPYEDYMKKEGEKESKKKEKMSKEERERFIMRGLRDELNGQEFLENTKIPKNFAYYIIIYLATNKKEVTNLSTNSKVITKYMNKIDDMWKLDLQTFQRRALEGTDELFILRQLLSQNEAGLRSAMRYIILQYRKKLLDR